jgi:hypothetical protein
MEDPNILGYDSVVEEVGPDQWCTQKFFFVGGGGSTNSVEDRGQRERRSGGSSPLVRGSTQFANE